MQFGRADTGEALEEWLHSSALDDRACAQNILFEERTSQARIDDLESFRAPPCADFESLRRLLIDHYRQRIFFDPVPQTFTRINSSAAVAALSPEQKMLRLESLSQPIVKLGVTFTQLQNAHQTDDLLSRDLLDWFCREWNERPDILRNPISFSAFKDENFEAYQSTDWPTRFRDKLGLAPEQHVSSRSRVTSYRVPAATARGGALRRIASGLSQRQDPIWAEEALRQVSRILSQAPNNEYAQFVENEIRNTEEDFHSGAFATAFVVAVQKMDPIALGKVEATFSHGKYLVNAAKACLFSDVIAANAVIAWMQAGGESEPRSASALRGFINERLLERNKQSLALVTAGQLVSLLASNDNFPIDLIESALAPVNLLIAA